ncbi:hypothetical protein J5N97_008763 [Dioscorea zingiberensis]|uniref:Phytochrome n=1 Tax=Dioscorea zingiberensis TaxID=325984 RepID=A0A9D5HL61_9LILI|nr:hypothetical protein J5N97_008763 [Dioscorea zingiberensis]
MPSSPPVAATFSASKSKQSAARVIQQTTVDAKNDAEFEEQGSSFDYSRTVVTRNATFMPEPQNSEKVTAYLQHIQKGKLIQPFGCLIAIDEPTFKVLAYSENALDMLTMANQAVPTGSSDRPSIGIGTDMRSIFTAPSVEALQKALGYTEVSLLNPILVHSKYSGKPFYAIVHRVVGCLVLDFEPVKPSELAMIAAGALQSYKLAAKAITRIQALPGGSLERLCEIVMEEVFELTGYDRVMVYKFHEDDHGEVYKEMTRPGLEPYEGLHYPATDIPQAARFLFMKNKVRMICDCRAKPVKIYQDETLPFDITFCGSTLRAAHSCHLKYMENMNSIASITMAVVVNDDEDEEEKLEPGQSQQPRQQKRKKLWGLVVCHNESPRFIPFPMRYACQFLMQVFAVHVTKEMESGTQIREKKILKTQTLLCDMLLREPVPLGIITQSPNIMDLVKCDGAALLYDNKIWRLGLTPADSEIRGIAHWLVGQHRESTGLSTDSLLDAGYPGAQALGDVVCGMAAARVTSKDILFWFRTQAWKEIRWGGARHDPDDKDDGTKLHPRSSFKAFLQNVKMRSLPWKDYEMDAIHSLQLILRGAFTHPQSVARSPSSLPDAQKPERIVELVTVTNEMVRLIETANVPILAVDVTGQINGWNLKTAQLTGISANEAIGKHLLELVEEASVEVVRKMLYLAFQGKEEQNVQFEMRTQGTQSEAGPVVLVVNACVSRDTNKNVVGVCFVAQDMTGHKMVMDKFTRIQGDYKAIVHNPSPFIPPIFGTDQFGWCSEWNAAMAKLSGWEREQVMNKMLLGEVFGGHNACCRLKNQEASVNLSITINKAVIGQGTGKVQFEFVNRNGEDVECLLSVSRKVDSDGVVTGVFCFLHTASQGLQQELQVQQLSEKSDKKKLKALAHIQHEMRTPLSGIAYSQRMLEATGLDEAQKEILRTGVKCHQQLNRILNDFNLENNIMDSPLELEMAEFVLQDVVTAAVSQVIVTGAGRGIRIINSLPDVFLTERLYGDNLRLQQILADFLAVSVKYSQCGGQVEITSSLNKDFLGECIHLVHLELSITHTGSGVPEELLAQMFGSDDKLSEEGISLFVCRKLVMLMNGDVHYLRRAGKSTFVISIELASATTSTKALAART